MRCPLNGKLFRICLISGLAVGLDIPSLPAQTMGTGISTGGGGLGTGTGGLGSSGFSSGGLQPGAMGSAGGTSPFASALTGTRPTTPTTGTTGSATAIPSAANLFRGYYASPLALGLSSSKSAKPSFGQPLYSLSTANANGLTGASTLAEAAGMGFTTVGLPRAPVYVTTLGEGMELPVTVPVKMQADLQEILARSTALQTRSQVKVVVKENVVILQGKVASAKERRLAEGLLRLTPGVREVDNQLTVSAAGQNSSAREGK